jgi:hypothetical protein
MIELYTGWWLNPTPLKNDGPSSSWDGDIPNIWKVIKFMFQTTKHIYIYIYMLIQYHFNRIPSPVHIKSETMVKKQGIGG